MYLPTLLIIRGPRWWRTKQRTSKNVRIEYKTFIECAIFYSRNLNGLSLLYATFIYRHSYCDEWIIVNSVLLPMVVEVVVARVAELVQQILWTRSVGRAFFSGLPSLPGRTSRGNYYKRGWKRGLYSFLLLCLTAGFLCRLPRLSIFHIRTVPITRPDTHEHTIQARA